MNDKNHRPTRRDAGRLPWRRAAGGLLAALLACGAMASAATAQPASAPLRDMADLKARITADDRRRPLVAIQLAEQALNQRATTPQDRLWLRSRLVRDLLRLKRGNEALVQAQRGRDEAGSPAERLHFDVLRLEALDETRRNDELLAGYQSLDASLPDFAAGQDSGARLDAGNAWRLGGTVMLRLGRLPESMALLTQALRVFDARPDAALETAETLAAMAMVHSRSGHADVALRTVQRAIDRVEAAGERSNQSRYQLRKAYFLGLLGRPDEQLATLLAARRLAGEELNDHNAAVAATNLADVSLQKRDYRAALAYAEQAIPLVERMTDKESLWVCWVNKGTALNRLGQPGGIEWIRRAIAAFASEPGRETNVAEIHGLLAEELAFNHDHARAFQAAMEFKRLTDNVRKAADQKRIAEANAAYEADKRQRQIEALEQEQRHQQRFRWMLGLAAGMALAAAVTAVVSRQHVKRAYAAMREMAFTDPLTGLRNRRHFQTVVDDEIAVARRQSAAPHAGRNTHLAFMMIDVDHFKAVNDQHGHAAGDAVLKQCATVLQRQLRESDTLVRWGGEEFLVLARQTSPAEVHVLAERLRASVAAHDFVLEDGLVLRKTCSIGFACYPRRDSATTGARQPEAWSDTVALADQCLYLAKTSGRDLWVGVTDGEAAADGPRPAADDLRAQVEAGGLVLHSTGARPLHWPQEPPTR
jgi:diguanylate cyclase (GGDEF)-like protein